ncbi:MAG: hypothetical protein JNL74_06440 [Fibrobacteres bacterium]|nr:hypothetical protein [Fibrobacterota bacterium]
MDKTITLNCEEEIREIIEKCGKEPKEGFLWFHDFEKTIVDAICNWQSDNQQSMVKISRKRSKELYREYSSVASKLDIRIPVTVKSVSTFTAQLTSLLIRRMLLLVVVLFVVSCTDLSGPSGMNVTFPVTYIEWEDIHPQDTTWWTLTADGKCYAAWKRKITEVSGAPAWYPHCLSYDKDGNCIPRKRPNGEIVGADGRTYQEYLDF